MPELLFICDNAVKYTARTLTDVFRYICAISPNARYTQLNCIHLQYIQLCFCFFPYYFYLPLSEKRFYLMLLQRMSHYYDLHSNQHHNEIVIFVLMSYTYVLCLNLIFFLLVWCSPLLIYSRDSILKFTEYTHLLT